MVDRHTVAQRSFNMSRIRSAGNVSTELTFVEVLKRNELTGWRRGFPIFGSPDFVFPRERVAVFIDGCFWHGCRKCAQTPTSNPSYWDSKFERNRLRDRDVNRVLRRDGWKVLRVWEHSLPHPARFVRSLRRALERTSP